MQTLDISLVGRVEVESCSMERCEAITSHAEFEAWIDERAEHANIGVDLLLDASVGDLIPVISSAWT